MVKDKKTQEVFIAQLKPLDDNLKRGIGMHNILDHPGFVQYRNVIAGPGSAIVVYEKWVFIEKSSNLKIRKEHISFFHWCRRLIRLGSWRKI